MLLDQIGLEDEGFDLVVHHNEFKIRDQLYELPRFRVLMTARVKILPYAIAQIFRLADVDDLARRIFVQVDAGRDWQVF